MLTSSKRRAAISSLATVALAVTAIWLGATGALAQNVEKKVREARNQPATVTQLKVESNFTNAGSYLAARHANVERDASAAALFYRNALRLDPKNNELLDRAFISSLADGNIDEAVRLGERVLLIDKNNRVARLVVGVKALKEKQYATAQQNINQSVRGPITDLVAVLLSGWATAGAGDARAAVASIDRLAGPEWYPLFKDFHTGLILDVAKERRPSAARIRLLRQNPKTVMREFARREAQRQKEAGVRYERAYKLDTSALRMNDAYARWLSRNKSPQPGVTAVSIYEDFDKKLPRHPLVMDAMSDLRAGKKLPPLVATPQAGAAEALYGIGASLTRRGGEDLALVYLQLALYLQPDHALALLSLADLYETVKKPAMAIKVYERMPANSPLKRNAQINLATNLDGVERSDEAIKILKDLVVGDPRDQESIMALGNVERARKKFSECSDTYAQGVKELQGTEKNAWVFYYFRGICEERSKQWPKAEASMKKALELQPEQPHVLNYLGYSWIDQGVNLDEGMKLIRRAVEQRPDDGYIVDSLGWAYYRVGNYEDAVKNLERAVDLKPEDPTINDHLGDAYWRVGRTLEARFQWAHARDLKPEADELPKIEAKIKDGLPEDTSSAASADKEKKDGKGG